MNQRSELRHRIVETREVALTWVANRLFSFKRNGIDGFLKKRMLPARRGQESAADD